MSASCKHVDVHDSQSTHTPYSPAVVASLNVLCPSKRAEATSPPLPFPLPITPPPRRPDFPSTLIQRRMRSHCEDELCIKWIGPGCPPGRHVRKAYYPISRCQEDIIREPCLYRDLTQRTARYRDCHLIWHILELQIPFKNFNFRTLYFWRTNRVRPKIPSGLADPTLILILLITRRKTNAVLTVENVCLSFTRPLPRNLLSLCLPASL